MYRAQGIKHASCSNFPLILMKHEFLYIYIILFFMKNTMSTIFSQQILSGMLLLVVTDVLKSKLSFEFNLEPITTFHLYMICCENLVDVTHFYLFIRGVV